MFEEMDKVVNKFYDDADEFVGKIRAREDYEMLTITDDMSEETKEQIRQANNMAGHLNYIHSLEVLF